MDDKRDTLGVRPPDADGPFGPIALVDFPPPKGCIGGSHGYTLDVPGFRSSQIESDPDAGSHPELLRNGEEIELWVWRLQVWRTCRFQWLGMRDPHLEVDVHHAGTHGLKVGETEKILDPRDLFRVTTRGAVSAMPRDAKRVLDTLRSAPGSSTDRMVELLRMPLGRTRAALKYLRDHGIASRERRHGLPEYFHTLTSKARR